MHRPSLFRRLVSGALVAGSVVFYPFSAPLARASSPIVIGEVAWAGSSLSTADEWLELWNLGDVDTPLGGYTLVGASTNPLALPPDAVIPAHGAYLISNYDASNTKSVLATDPQYVTTEVALSNSALQIILQDPTGTEIDRAGSGDTPPAGQSGTAKVSMIRDGEIWVAATTTHGMKDGTLDLGTPGFCDECIIETEPAIEPPPPEPEPLLVVATSTPETPIEQSSASTTEIVFDIVSTSTSDANTTTTEIAISMEEELPTTVETTTSTVVVPLIEIETTSTEQIVEMTADTTSSATTTVTETTTEIVEPPRYDLLRLNEISPNPADGSEWVEITSIEPAISIPLADVQLFDAVGRVLTIATGTIDAQTPFVRVALSSSRLNNGGDTVSIQDPNGGILDTVTYVATPNGTAWARSPDATGEWHETTTQTPDAANVVPEPTPAPTVVAVATASETPSQPSPPVVSLPTTTIAPPPVSTVIKTSLQKAPTATKKTKTTPATTTTKKATAEPTKPKTTTVKKTTKTVAKTNTYKLLTFDMLNPDIDRGIRVSLQGVVGSPSGLLTSHGFILLSPDGRGLLVRVPASRKLPTLGETLVVSGTLLFDDTNVPSIKLNAGDGWTTAKNAIPSVASRDADLFTPSAEDAWSLVSVSGTVLAIKNTTVIIMSDGADVDVAIRKVVGYRASRLSIGDTITVTGLLNTSTDVPRIFPRTSADITLVSHAAKKPTDTSPALPGWTPFGAAGLAVAGTEGAKHWRERRKRRTLEKILEKDMNASL